MTVNIKALELAIDIFRLRMQNEMRPNFSECLVRAIELQCEEKPDYVETITAPWRDWRPLCNCPNHDRAGTTGGWYCPVHGRML